MSLTSPALPVKGGGTSVLVKNAPKYFPYVLPRWYLFWLREAADHLIAPSAPEARRCLI